VQSFPVITQTIHSVCWKH